MEIKTIKELLAEHNLQHSVWGKKILKAQKSPEGFTLQDKYDSMSWVTCACGRVTADIPRRSRLAEVPNQPLDFLLRMLGSKFYSKVCEDNPLEAAKTLVKIEARALVVAAKRGEEQC